MTTRGRDSYWILSLFAHAQIESNSNNLIHDPECHRVHPYLIKVSSLWAATSGNVPLQAYIFLVEGALEFRIVFCTVTLPALNCSSGSQTARPIAEISLDPDPRFTLGAEEGDPVWWATAKVYPSEADITSGTMVSLANSAPPKALSGVHGESCGGMANLGGSSGTSGQVCAWASWPRGLDLSGHVNQSGQWNNSGEANSSTFEVLKRCQIIWTSSR